MYACIITLLYCILSYRIVLYCIALYCMFKRSSVQAFPDVLPETMKRFDYPGFEFQLSRIIWGGQISNSEFAEELFGGFEFRVTDSRQIYLSALRISN